MEKKGKHEGEKGIQKNEETRRLKTKMRLKNTETNAK